MDPKMIDVLVCPICKGPLHLDRERQLLICKADQLAYPIRDGVPIMLEEEAQAWTAPDTQCATASGDAAGDPLKTPTAHPDSTPETGK